MSYFMSRRKKSSNRIDTAIFYQNLLTVMPRPSNHVTKGKENISRGCFCSLPALPPL